MAEVHCGVVSSLTVAVVGTQAATPRSTLLSLDVAGHAFVHVAGQAVLVRRPGEAVGRPYSIACSPEQITATGRLELLVVHDAESATALAAQPAGSRLVVEGPLGAFTFPESAPERHLFFIAGGAGIAPLRAMIDHALRGGYDGQISLFYSARRRDEFAFIEEFASHAAAGRLALHQTVTRDDGMDWSGRRGRVDREHFESALHDPGDTLCFVCGPSSMVEDAVAALARMGVPAARIRTERWGR
ncbi:MAG: ferredoxin--NADP reductase [Vicinamibacterales bacterium]